MNLEVYNADFRFSLALYDEKLALLVRSSERMVNIRVLPAGVCAYRAIFHSEATDKCNIRGSTASVAHFRFCKVVKCENRGITEALHNPLYIFFIIEAVSVL